MRRGVSLLEVVVAVALLAIGIVFVLSLLPSSVLTLKRAEDMQAATAYGMEVLHDAELRVPSIAGRDRDLHFEINGTSFHVTRDVLPVDALLTDVVVTVKWRDDVPPLKLATRLAAAATPAP